MKIQIILGSTRPNRNGEGVAKWVEKSLKQRSDIDVELVDIADYNLPLLDEPLTPSQGQYSNPHTKKWAEKIAEADGYIFVTAEYNHSVPGALKNAIDYLYAEWNNKAAGFVSYGAASSGSRAVEHLRGIMGELQIADVRAQVLLSLFSDFENFSTFKPGADKEDSLNTMLEQLIPWTEAMQSVRQKLAITKE